MARLPQPGGDAGNWGDILNDYLAQAHSPDGLLKNGSVTSASIVTGAITATHLAVDAVAKNQLNPGLRSEVDAKLSRTTADTLYAQTTHVRDIRDFLQGSEVLDRTGATDMSVIIQRAVNALTAAYDADTSPYGTLGYQIYFPAGRYRINENVQWGRGVGVRGESQQSTVFEPYAAKTFIFGEYPSAGYYFTDCWFTDFTVDGRNQNALSYATQVKGIFVQRMKRSRYENVTCKNIWATGFGVDHLEDTYFINCTAENCGRGLAALGRDPATSSGHSGFGIGTGGSTVEQVAIVNCIARENGLYGFFTEKQTSDVNYPHGFRLIGCIAENNYIGFKDCGSTGAIVQGNQFIKNTRAGAALAGTILAPNAGIDGLITGNVIYDNAVGIEIGQMQAGYSITGNEILGNDGAGIATSTSGVVGARLRIEDNRIHDNGAEGIHINKASQYLTIKGNEIWNNTAIDVLIDGSVTANGLAFIDNDVRSANVSITQTLVDEQIARNMGFSLATAQNLRVTGHSADTVSIAWDMPVDDGGITDFVYQHRVKNSSSWTDVAHTASLALSYTFTSLPPLLEHEFRIGTKVGSSITGYTGVISETPRTDQVQVGDSFNRADAASLGSSDLGTLSPIAWAGSGWSIAGNTATATSASTWATLNHTKSVYLAKITVLTLLGSYRFAIRYVSNTNLVFLGKITATSHWGLISLVGSTFTTLLDLGPIPANGDTVQVLVAGDLIRVWINGTLSGEVTSTVANTGTSVAIMGGVGQKFDNLEIKT